MVVPADPEKRFPVLEDHCVSLPDTHTAIIDMVWFGTTSVKLDDLEIAAIFQVFNRTCFNIITPVIEPGLVAQPIKHFMHALVDFIMEIGELRAAVMVAGVRQVKDFTVG